MKWEKQRVHFDNEELLQIVNVGDNKRYVVATVNQRSLLLLHEIESHACLIAAAPDLLAGVKDAVAYLDKCDLEHVELYNQLLKLIEKAEGK